MIDKLVIANRGEVALRILRAVLRGLILDWYAKAEARGEGDMFYIFFTTNSGNKVARKADDGRTLKRDFHGGGYHGGWGGEPANLVAVCQYLHEHHKAKHVGIVYNLHHGHGHISDFEKSFKLMQPYLHCLNLNGMNEGAKPKILSIGKGQHEAAMISTIRKSGYAGPIGILDHRNDTDTEIALRENLEGLQKILKK